MSQEDLAAYCGLHPTSLSRIERGEMACSVLLLSYIYCHTFCAGVNVEREGFVPDPDVQLGHLATEHTSQLQAAEMIWKIGQVVHGRRGDMDMTLEDAANGALIHRNTLWAFEKGLIVPCSLTYFRILRMLEVRSVYEESGVPVFR